MGSPRPKIGHFSQPILRKGKRVHLGTINLEPMCKKGLNKKVRFLFGSLINVRVFLVDLKVAHFKSVNGA